MKSRNRKCIVYAMSQAYHAGRFWMTDEEYAWECMAPVGREWGSPDYERLTKLDALADAAEATANRASKSIDQSIQFVEESNNRIRAMEKGK